MPLPEVEELKRLTEKALARYDRQLRYRDHVASVLAALDGLVERTREIDRLRAARDRPGTPKDHANLVDAVSRRLTAVRSLLIR
jgi:hypothetical protein